jgi:hypothetical protein
LLLRIVDTAQARRLSLKSNVEIRRWNGGEELCDGLLRVRIVSTAQLRVDGCRLVSRHTRASAKRHVLLSMSHPRKTNWSFVTSNHEVHLDGRYGSERVVDHYHAKAGVQSCPNHRLLFGRSLSAHHNEEKAKHRRQRTISIHFDILPISIRFSVREALRQRSPYFQFGI